MLEVWINKRYIPASEQPNTNDRYIKIFINDKCDSCAKSIVISPNYPGDKDNASSFLNPCSHYKFWPDVWKNRIIPKGVPVQGAITANGVMFPNTSPALNNNYIAPVFMNPNNDPTKDGMKCSGSCGNWHPMVVANQIDGTFICYACRIKY